MKLFSGGCRFCLMSCKLIDYVVLFDFCFNISGQHFIYHGGFCFVFQAKLADGLTLKRLFYLFKRCLCDGLKFYFKAFIFVRRIVIRGEDTYTFHLSSISTGTGVYVPNAGSGVAVVRFVCPICF